MYTSNVKAVIQDETMTAINSLGRIRQLNIILADSITRELRTACIQYRDKDIAGKVVSFTYSRLGQTGQYWAKIIDIYPPHNIRGFIPKTAKNTSPKLNPKLYGKYL